MEESRPLEELLNGELVEEAKKFLFISYLFDIMPKEDKSRREEMQSIWVKFVYKLDDKLRIDLFKKLESEGLVEYVNLTASGTGYAKILSNEYLHQYPQERQKWIDYVNKLIDCPNEKLA